MSTRSAGEGPPHREPPAFVEVVGEAVVARVDAATEAARRHPELGPLDDDPVLAADRVPQVHDRRWIEGRIGDRLGSEEELADHPGPRRPEWLEAVGHHRVRME